MLPVTPAFMPAITAGRRVALSCLAGDLDITDRVIGGTVTEDARASVQGRLDLVLSADADIIPSTSADPLAPYGREITVGRGVRYPDGTTEIVSLGLFDVRQVGVEDRGADRVLRITGQDRSARVIDARIEEQLTIAVGTNVNAAITDLVSAAIPAVIDLTPTVATTPTIVSEEGDDRWALASSLADSVGYHLSFDRGGHLISRPWADLSNPVLNVFEGDSGLLLDAANDWDRARTYNRVIATGEGDGTNPPVRGVATDDDPLSPTFYGGPFGKVPRFYRSQFITTTEQAIAAAQGFLARERGTTQQMTLTAHVVPHLEVGDTIRITRHALGVIEREHAVDALTIPLTGDAGMTIRTREVRGH
ncbi:MAG: DUF5047 domain-containing protein [Solirubrobacteraceae bacterium]|nr:DUF5047 domain-containing protein [Solirubrobacteraceae bacterium]